jgi:hypothetical protein
MTYHNNLGDLYVPPVPGWTGGPVPQMPGGSFTSATPNLTRPTPSTSWRPTAPPASSKSSRPAPKMATPSTPRLPQLTSTLAVRREIAALAVRVAPSNAVTPTAPGQFVARAVAAAARLMSDRASASRVGAMALGFARFRDQAQIEAGLAALSAAQLSTVRDAARNQASLEAAARAQSGATAAPPRATVPTYKAPTQPSTLASGIRTLFGGAATATPSRAGLTLFDGGRASAPPRHAEEKPITPEVDAPDGKIYSPPSPDYSKPDSSYAKSSPDSSYDSTVAFPEDEQTVEATPEPETTEALPLPSLLPGPMKIWGVPWYFVAGGAAAVVVGGYVMTRKRAPTPNRRRRSRR